MLKTIYNLTPNTIKILIRPFYVLIKKSYYHSLDFRDYLSGRRKQLIPPRSMIFIGDGDFLKIGSEFLSYFIELCHLKPDEKILDVGCGIGRMAIPLTNYLNEKSEYQGLDIVEKGINWCRKNISVKYSHFNFQVADVFNKMYNPKGNYHPSKYKFPYKNNYFDFVFLTSVFTHMYEEDIENYLKEISRVIKKNGRCLITFFLINEESRKLIAEGKSSQNFRIKLGGSSFTIDKNIRESAIAFNENYVLNLFESDNFSILNPINYGSWCGRENFKSYQDIIIARKN